MNGELTVQIIGTRKNAATRKAIRFFSERGVKAHIVDLNERPLKRGELENITRKTDADELIDRESATFRNGGFAFLQFNPIEELLEHPLLMKMPVVRCGNEVSVGESIADWNRWIGR